MLLSETMDNCWANNRPTKILNGKAKEWDTLRNMCFEKPVYISGNLKSRCILSIVHMIMKDLRNPSAFTSSWPWNTGQAGSEGKESCKLLDWVLVAYPNKNRTHWQRLGNLGSRHLRKSLSYHLLTTKAMKQRYQWLHIIQTADFMELIQKRHQTNNNYNKQQQTLRNRGRGEFWLPELPYYNVKMSIFLQKLTSMQRNKKLWPCIGKITNNRNCFWGSTDTGFAQQKP